MVLMIVVWDGCKRGIRLGEIVDREKGNGNTRVSHALIHEDGGRDAHWYTAHHVNRIITSWFYASFVLG